MIFESFDFDNISIDLKPYKTILIYNISNKILIGVKSLLIRFNKIDGFVRVYNVTRYLVLFDPEFTIG